MKDFILIMADILPEDEIIDAIGKAVEKFRLDPSKENRGALTMYCTLFATKAAIGQKNVFEISKELEQVSRIKEKLNSEKM